MKKRVALIGLGVISRFYVEALKADPRFTLTAVCDLRPELLELFDATSLRTETDYRSIISRDDIDAVIITVPNDRHFEIAAAALRAGKHVCCEKPLALESWEARELCRIARTVQRTIFTGFHRRYNKNFIDLKERLAASKAPTQMVSARYCERIEDHSGVDAWYLDPKRCGGGCVIDNGPNVFDCLIQLFGGLEVCKAELAYARGQATENLAHIHLVNRQGLPVYVHLDWSYQDGELKDIIVVGNEGNATRADLLAGFDEFKSSLWHEYVGILDDFARRIETGAYADEDGAAVTTLIDEVYQMARRGAPCRASGKKSLDAAVVKILEHKRLDRGMKLLEFESRCIKAGEIHELVLTDQLEARAEARIDRVGFLGFGEFGQGGIIERGDAVYLGARKVGTVIGFDDCHFPNHYNILIGSDELRTGPDLGLKIGDAITFSAPAVK